LERVIDEKAAFLVSRAYFLRNLADFDGFGKGFIRLKVSPFFLCDILKPF
jgi:hypothetical protein